MSAANTTARRRHFTPPQVADLYGVATTKVLLWIRRGELKALNLAHRGCTRPRYSISPDALDQFEKSRTVVPDGGLSATKRLRRAAAAEKDYFADL